MPFLNESERKLVKAVLSDVLDDADLKAQFNKAQAEKNSVVSDYRDAMLGQYMGILKEISTERANYVPPKDVVQGPDLETLKKKYSGPKK